MRAGIGKGRAPPAWYYERPFLTEEGAWILHAFDDLSTCRQIVPGFTGPVPWRDVHAYAQACEMSAAQAGIFAKLVRSLDLAYLGWAAEQRERARAAAESKE